MTLHLVGAAPGTGCAWSQCLRAVAPGDAILLLGDAVYAALPGGEGSEGIAALAEATRVLALDEDCVRRGIAALSPRVQRTDWAGVVALACEHPRSASWF